MDLETWNSEQLWRECYGTLAENCLFFAEDIFGVQFCILNDKICSFEPETGDIKEISDSLDFWAKYILEDYKVLTGYPIAHLWQKQYRSIPINTRLVPKIPFVCGGKFEIDNLYLIDATEGMKFRASIAQQIQNSPDGTNISIKIVN